MWLLGKGTDVVVQLLGGDPHVRREELTGGASITLTSGRGWFCPLVQLVR
ncbi:hypothetical protein GCM10009632_27970 [Mycolicibacterium alvei]|uniref:Uncharacterized protein n=1 Tax=Mycolicibacterium alvei TaxID=67081 RepID=A0A6N4UPV8_9MYCO|nr:hypothetical protein MALV_08020 [Mycolicibacterium alvei]